MTNKVIGIFSRDGEESYEWLINFLLTLPGVRDVRPVYIPPDSSRHFRDELSKCSFAIVYHTQNRGRLNLTDVADSLYDTELEALSGRLGRENVIVVIDDLRTDDTEQKDRILRNQPKLGRLAQDVFLFTTKEKQKIHEQPQYQTGAGAGAGARNLQEMRKLIVKDSRSRWCSKWLLIGVGVVGVIVLIIVICVIKIHPPKGMTSGNTSATYISITRFTGELNSTSDHSSISDHNSTRELRSTRTWG